MWNETPEEQEKRREWLRGVYDRSAMKNEQQSAYPGNDNQNGFGQSTYQPQNDMNYNSETTSDTNNLAEQAKCAANGFTQGASFGFADEVYGAAQGGWNGIKNYDNNPWQHTKDAYAQNRDKVRNHLDYCYDSYPVTTATAEIAGAVASPINKIGSVAEFAPRSVQMARGLSNAARNGAIYGFGAGEGDVASQLQNTVVGGVSGVVGNQTSRMLRPATSSLFMNQTSRNLANNVIENTAGNTFQSGINKLEDLWKRRF